MVTPSDRAPELRARIRELYDLVGRPTYERLSATAALLGRQLPTSTIGNLLNGPTAPRRQTLDTFVLTCQRLSAKAGSPDMGETFDLAAWHDAYDRQLSTMPEPAAPHAAQPSGTDADLVRTVLVPRMPLPASAPPSFLLRSEYAVVPFHGREHEVDAFTSWCLATEPLGLRLCFAPGGQGKTRLAHHLADAMSRTGSAAGVLRAHVDRRALTRLVRNRRDVLLIIDYAEVAAAGLPDILELVAEALSDGGRIRVLLLARGNGEWWHQLRGPAVGPVGCAGPECRTRIASAVL